MAEKATYKCEQCDGLKDVTTDDKAPECCGKTMVAVQEPMAQCTSSSTAEHSRMDDMGEPCDDGRAG